MSTRHGWQQFFWGSFLGMGCTMGCSGIPSIGDVILDAGAIGGSGGSSAIGGSSTTGGLSTGGTLGSGGAAATGGAPNCMALVTDLGCVTDNDCCLVSTYCQTALWLVTKSEQAALAACLGTPTAMCPACMAPEVNVTCNNGQCVAAEVGQAWPPAGLSAPHCGKVSVGTGGASSASAAMPIVAIAGATSTAGTSSTGGTSSTAGTSATAATTIFGCG